MSSAISSIGSSIRAMPRPDPEAMASKLFAKLDTSNQGFIEKADLQSAVDSLGGTATSSDSTTAVDDLFKKLDGDSDGKITKQELTDGVKKLTAQFDEQFNRSRVGGSATTSQTNSVSSLADTIFSQIDTNNQGYIDKAGLQSALGQTGDTTSSNVDDLFNKFDGDGNGKITKQELSDGIQKIADERDNHFSNLTAGRTRTEGSRPPPPDAAQGSASVSSSTDASSSTASTTATYEKADTNQDGTVSIKEQMAYQRAVEAASASASSQVSEESKSGSIKSALRLMTQLMQAYGNASTDFAQNATSSTISAQA